MLFSSFEIYKYSIPIEPFTIATGTMTYAQNIFVRAHTDAGIVGVGECSAFPMIVGETQATCFAMAADFAELWKGKNAIDIDARLQELDLYTAGNYTAKSAFDMVLFDIGAKAVGAPLYKFLGGFPRKITTDLTIGLDSPEVMAKKAADFVSRGIKIIKVKLGKDPQQDIERVRRIRETVGPDIELRIDANQGWSFEEALYALMSMESFNIRFCEQPMRTWDDDRLPILSQMSSIPIMADESVYNYHDADRLISKKAISYINIKFAKSGGINGARKINSVAERMGVPCMLGGMLESRLALTAKAHFATAHTNIEFFDLDTCLLGHLDDPVVGGVGFRGMDLHLSDAPGIGADVDQSYLNRCAQLII